MDVLQITGGTALAGEVRASGSKNAALPIMSAAILAGAPVLLERVPRLADVDTLSLLLGHLGVEVKRDAAGTVRLETIDPTPTKADYTLVRRMRASFCVLGPLLARRGRAVVSLPGGCNIGTRPVDLHLAGLSALGAEISIRHGYVVAKARRLRGAVVDLGGPHGPTVTGTANVMSAATLRAAHGHPLGRPRTRDCRPGRFPDSARRTNRRARNRYDRDRRRRVARRSDAPRDRRSDRGGDAATGRCDHRRKRPHSWHRRPTSVRRGRCARGRRRGSPMHRSRRRRASPRPFAQFE